MAGFNDCLATEKARLERKLAAVTQLEEHCRANIETAPHRRIGMVAARLIEIGAEIDGLMAEAELLREFDLLLFDSETRRPKAYGRRPKDKAA